MKKWILPSITAGNTKKIDFNACIIDYESHGYPITGLNDNFWSWIPVIGHPCDRRQSLIESHEFP